MGIKINGVSQTKTLHTERQAAIAYDIYARREWGDHAFLNLPSATPAEVAEVEAILLNPKSYTGTSSKYVGVCKTPYGTWTARVRLGGRHVHLGTFATEIDAAIAYNRHVEEFGTPNISLNALPQVAELAHKEVAELKAKLANE